MTFVGRRYVQYFFFIENRNRKVMFAKIHFTNHLCWFTPIPRFIVTNLISHVHIMNVVINSTRYLIHLCMRTFNFLFFKTTFSQTVFACINAFFLEIRDLCFIAFVKYGISNF